MEFSIVSRSIRLERCRPHSECPQLRPHPNLRSNEEVPCHFYLVFSLPSTMRPSFCLRRPRGLEPSNLRKPPRLLWLAIDQDFERSSPGSLLYVRPEFAVAHEIRRWASESIA